MHAVTTPNQSLTQQITDRRDRYMTINYPRYGIAMVSGQGCQLVDAAGKEYLDLFAGFGASILGHCHPDLVKAVTEQANKLWHVGNLFHSEPQTILAEQIARHGFNGRSFLCHSGADANEAALKLARLYGQANPGPNRPRYKVISTLNSFHGRSFGTMLATAQSKVSKGFDPFLPGFASVPYDDLSATENAVDDQTVAVIVEPIQGESGVNIPSDDYLPGLRTLCDQRDLLLIVDEVWTGCGRTGRLFAHQHWGIEPDIMTLAKGVGGGLPVGVMCARPAVAEYFNCKTQGGVKHATTLGGNCVSMAASIAVFDVIERDHLLAHATELGRYVVERLQRFAVNRPIIKQVRGKGLLVGIELDPEARDSSFKDAAEIVNRCMQRGVLLNATQNNVVRLAPPLIVTRDQIDQGLEVFEQALAG